jgi:amphi-Trp domain-containing protein
MGHKEREHIEYAGVMSAERAADYFESLAAGLRQHIMVLESGESSLALDIAHDVKVEMEAQANIKKSSIEFELSWRPEAGTEIARPVLHVLSGDEMRRELAGGVDEVSIESEGAQRTEAETEPVPPATNGTESHSHARIRNATKSASRSSKTRSVKHKPATTRRRA